MRWNAIALVFALIGGGCSNDRESLVIYSGRSQELVAPLIEEFEAATGIRTSVRYAASPELAGTLIEEGDHSPADVFFAQDPASLGRVAELLAPLPTELMNRIPLRFGDRARRWVGVSGRARVLVYNPTTVETASLPDSVHDLTTPDWDGRLALAPTNGSFLSFVSTMLLVDGEESTRQWLEAVAKNHPIKLADNPPIVEAVAVGVADAGLTNHYYTLRLNAERPEAQVANHFFAAGDPGSLVMPAGVGVLRTSKHQDEAKRFVDFLLSESAQRHFANETLEYPLLAAVPADPSLPPLASLHPPDIDLTDLAAKLDLATTLVSEVGLI